MYTIGEFIDTLKEMDRDMPLNVEVEGLDGGVEMYAIGTDGKGVTIFCARVKDDD